MKTAPITRTIEIPIVNEIINIKVFSSGTTGVGVVAADVTALVVGIGVEIVTLQRLVGAFKFIIVVFWHSGGSTQL